MDVSKTINTVAVAICSYGDKTVWNKVAERALTSISNQTRVPDQIIRIHGNSLCEARNRAIELAETEHIVFCDADDELDENYVAAMLAGSGDLRYPRVQYIDDSGKNPSTEPLELNRGNLLYGNFIVIGAMMRKKYFKLAGGFDNSPVLEDYRVWIRAWLAGADIQFCNGAIYKAHVNPNSRNRQDPELHRKIMQLTIDEYTPIARQKHLI